MGKAKKFKGLKSSCKHPKTKGRKTRRAILELTEIMRDEDGQLCVDFDFKDSMIREYGRLGLFDSAVLMIKNSIEETYKDLPGNLESMINLQCEKVNTVNDQEVEIFHLKAKLEEVRKAAINIKTGRGGSSIKSDPFTLRSQFLSILNS